MKNLWIVAALFLAQCSNSDSDTKQAISGEGDDGGAASAKTTVLFSVLNIDNPQDSAETCHAAAEAAIADFGGESASFSGSADATRKEAVEQALTASLTYNPNLGADNIPAIANLHALQLESHYGATLIVTDYHVFANPADAERAKAELLKLAGCNVYASTVSAGDAESTISADSTPEPAASIDSSNIFHVGQCTGAGVYHYLSIQGKSRGWCHNSSYAMGRGLLDGLSAGCEQTIIDKMKADFNYTHVEVDFVGLGEYAFFFLEPKSQAETTQGELETLNNQLKAQCN